MWWLLGLTGSIAALVGLPGDVARDLLLERAAPILVFLTAITVLAELADRAGVFDVAAHHCARVARGSVWRLYLLVAALATLTTVTMSLDTTAVLLTPVVLTLATRLDLDPMPFALLVVWLANTASLLLPVSNLTNLLALHHTGITGAGFTVSMALPALVAVLVTVGYLALVHRRSLTGRFTPPGAVDPSDRGLFWLCALACLALAPGVVLGYPPWAVALACVAPCLIGFAIRHRTVLRWGLLPWRTVVLIGGLFLLVTTVGRHGGTDLLARLVGDPSSLQSVAVTAAGSNLVNNLPAYLAVEPTVPAGDASGTLALLLGTNLGPLVLLWGSVATLLWRDRLLARGLVVPAGRFALLGLGGVPVLLVASWAALGLTG